ncbi:unnamed protein product, partial [Candidula unifasciata]
REPQVEIDIEENGGTEQTHDNDGQSEGEDDHNEIKDGIGNIGGDETSPNGMGNHNSQHLHDVIGGIDDTAEDDESRANEDKPLMN